VAQGRLGALIEIQALRALALSASGDQAGAVAALTLGLQVGVQLEERGLARQFGDQWKAYASTVPRLIGRRRDDEAT
jgi:protein-S-isoprenylcysteine O-methyltransferase Ste14